MPHYVYQARDKNGKLADGSLEATSQDQVVSRLQGMGLFPLSISENGRAGGTSLVNQIVRKPQSHFSFGGRIKTRDLTNFTRQLSDLLMAGLTLSNALGVLVNQTENLKLKEIIRAVRNDVQAGGTLADALGKHPKAFSKLFISMIKAGEIGGLLETVLMRLADFQEKEDEQRGKILAAMAYPIVMLVVGSGAIILLMTYVIPKFVSMFQEMGVTLPLPTQILIAISDFLQNYWWIIFTGIAITIISIQRIFKTVEGKRLFHRWQLKLPLLGDLIMKREIARFARTFGELLKNGVNILQALQISSDTMNNQIIAEEIAKIRTNISEGERISDPLKNSVIFPPVVVNMIAVGEESGQLENVLMKIAASFESDVDRSVKTVTSLFEPAIILFMGVVVGFIALSMLLPVFTINLGVTK